MEEFSLNIEGANLITSAYIFGGAGIAFAFLPFLSVLSYGVAKANSGNPQSTNGTDIFSIVIMAFIVHFIACVAFAGGIKALEAFSIDDPNFYTQKVFPIFWADTQTQVFALAGVTTTDTTEVSLAYTTLHFIQSIVKLGLTLLPILTFIVASVYGFWVARKDSYETSYISVLAFSAISFVIVSIVYISWAVLAQFALFIPDGQNIFDMITNYWKNILGII